MLRIVAARIERGQALSAQGADAQARRDVHNGRRREGRVPEEVGSREVAMRALEQVGIPDTAAESRSSALQSSVTWRAVTLLDLVARSETGVGVREAARLTGIDRSAVNRLLTQLEEIGWVTQAHDRGVYTVGPRLFAVGAAVRARDSLWKAAEPILRGIVDRYDETCYLTVRQDHQVVFREKVDCAQRIRYVVDLGTTFDLTTGAAGRAILSGMPDEEVDEVLAAGLVAHTERSVTDPDEYRRQLADDRRLGYSVSVRRWIEDGAGVASPFFDATGACAGALTLSCPADRLQAGLIPEIGQAMLEAGRELSQRLGSNVRWAAGEV
jgi:DNA-binding IclR family transcriptional regulator